MTTTTDITPSNPPFPFHKGSDEGGFARPTVLNRWPVIVTDVINAILKSDRSQDEGSKIIAELSKLKYEMAREKPLARLQSASWNKAIETYFPDTSFFTTSWLFAECYLYARIDEAINSQPAWRGFDPFLESKQSGFKDLSAKVAAIAETQHTLVKLAPTASTEAFRVHLRDLLLLSLWGNATDLSMFAGLSEAQILEMRKDASGESNIISNHLDEIVAYVEDAFPKAGNGRLDFVLDNSGFEQFSDLILADYLHQSGRVSKTYFHCKTIPWFVSDTMPQDFDWLLSALDNPLSFFFSPNASSKVALEYPTTLLQELATRWRTYISTGAWVITSDEVWCTFWAHHHLPTVAPKVFKDLAESQLVIFKGDLNYRKLIYDCKFPATTPFADAIGDVRGLRAVVSLRTNKSDPIVGLAEGVEQRLEVEGVTDWRWSGKLAVVEFYKR
ncbi:hypothetical protein HDU79_003552 [Rhizoclosmatium sp. JEL0117]|nr:hypothetical protein HDU79_003552 [Rhizoclosmatium sp. JEL0117]